MDPARFTAACEAALTGDRLFQLGKRPEFPCQQLAHKLELRTGRPCGACLAAIQPARYRQLSRSRPERFARFAQRVWDIPPAGRTPAQLAQAGLDALEDLIREQGRAELTCQFCDKVYQYSKEDLETLLASLEK